MAPTPPIPVRLHTGQRVGVGVGFATPPTERTCMPTRPWRSFGMSTCAPLVYVPRAFGGRSRPNLPGQQEGGGNSWPLAITPCSCPRHFYTMQSNPAHLLTSPSYCIRSCNRPQRDALSRNARPQQRDKQGSAVYLHGHVCMAVYEGVPSKELLGTRITLLRWW